MAPVTMGLCTVIVQIQCWLGIAMLIGLGLSKLFHVFGLEDLALDDLSNSMGLFLQVSYHGSK